MRELLKYVAVVSLQIRGHHIADLDPLGISSADLDDRIPPELLYNHYSFGKICTNLRSDKPILISILSLFFSINYFSVVLSLLNLP
jgi:hypothetical protein